MVTNQPCHILGQLRVSDSGHDPRHEVGADFSMAVGAPSSVDEDSRCRLADIMEKDSPKDTRIGFVINRFEGKHGMDKGVAFRVIFLRLRNPAQGRDLRQKVVEGTFL